MVSSFAPAFPPQKADVSYGIARAVTEEKAIAATSAGRFLVPTSGALGSSWIAPGFVDSSWTTVQAAVGYQVASGATQTAGFYTNNASFYDGSSWSLFSFGTNPANYSVTFEGTRVPTLYRFTDLDAYELPKVGVQPCKATHDYLRFESFAAAEQALQEGLERLRAEGRKKQLSKKFPVPLRNRVASETERIARFIGSETEQRDRVSVPKRNRKICH